MTSRPAERNRELVELGDIDELVRQVERLLADRDWDGVVDLRDRCERAVERGFQLWGVAGLADYRLALEAPPSLAVAVVVEGRGRFALGPLAEVVASSRSWAEVGSHVPPGLAGSVIAHELVARGADLSLASPPADPIAFDLPLALTACEQAYPAATYKADSVTVEDPPRFDLLPVLLPEDPPSPLDEPEVIDALLGVTRVWQTQSNGKASAVAVPGTSADAVRALGITRARTAEVPPAIALAHLAWAGSSGGAHGRRRGLAAGRFEAWWVTAAIGGALDDWPIDATDFDEIVDGLRWYLWDAHEPETGWSLRLAVEDPAAGLAWAVAAIDGA